MSDLSIEEMRAMLDGAPGKSDDEVRRIHDGLRRYAQVVVAAYLTKQQRAQASAVPGDQVRECR